MAGTRANIARDLGSAREAKATADLLRTSSNSFVYTIKLATQLQSGYNIYIKFADGRNLSRALECDLNAELARINSNMATVSRLLVDAAEFCFNRENTDDGTFPDRLQHVSISLEELLRLGRTAQSAFNIYLDELIRFKSVQKTLAGREDTVMFKDRPLIAVATDSVQLMFDMRSAGYTIADLELAVDSWIDGTIKPTIKRGVVQAADLIASLNNFLES